MIPARLVDPARSLPTTMLCALALAVLLVAAAVRPALAQSCNTSATPMTFGSYNPITSATTDTTATINVTCSTTVGLLVNYTIQLYAGGGGSFAARSMAGGTPRLGYQIYNDSGRSQVWGDGTAGTTYVSDGFLLTVGGSNKNYTAYGRLPAHEQSPPGAYTDAVTVLLSY